MKKCRDWRHCGNVDDLKNEIRLTLFSGNLRPLTNRLGKPRGALGVPVGTSNAALLRYENSASMCTFMAGEQTSFSLITNVSGPSLSQQQTLHLLTTGCMPL